MRTRIENSLLKAGFSRIDAHMSSWLITIIFVLFLIIRIAIGMHDANDPSQCKANSINDILLLPAYALGCNLAKDRFDLKLN